jgi:hypothetical protein
VRASMRVLSNFLIRYVIIIYSVTAIVHRHLFQTLKR